MFATVYSRSGCQRHQHSVGTNGSVINFGKDKTPLCHDPESLRLTSG